MKAFFNVLLVITVSALLAASWKTLCGNTNLGVFLGPLAILTSAFLAIRAAIMSIDSTRKMNQENRTIEFLTKEYPLTGDILKDLSSGEQESA